MAVLFQALSSSIPYRTPHRRPLQRDVQPGSFWSQQHPTPRRSVYLGHLPIRLDWVFRLEIIAEHLTPPLPSGRVIPSRQSSTVAAVRYMQLIPLDVDNSGDCG